ncbi:PTS sugar transporter subunit IIC [Romboutsia weinsteinii]|uniref:PTS sugar transporter subunit IIC n=1 Tax=Romboutsia weinsteinii TaxID=2020949 RepID=A0A371J8W5_9FIRM|nr:PTS transporter subunit EIIC [Romboutsia weinsteinii]RDY29175.1 PTS sugar transporter subunit IIC [Romboutsia weinsteinii]
MADKSKNQAYEIALQIYNIVGEKENVISVSHCMTRLRLGIKDTSIFSQDELKKIEGVMGVVEQEGQLQIILGPGRVNKVCEEFSKLTGKKVGEVDTASDLRSEIKQKNQTPFKLLLKQVANIFIPLIPAFIGCGLVLALSNLLGKFVDGWSATTIGMLMAVVGNGVFGVINVLVGVNASKEFGGSPMIGGTLAAIMSSAALSDIVLFGNNLVPGRGGVLAVLAVCALACFLEKKIRKIVPETLDLFITPLLVILLSIIVAIFVIQPVGGFIADSIGVATTVAIEKGGAFTGFLLGGLFLPLVMTGLHHGLTPIHAQLIESFGMTTLLPILAMAGAGQVGASFAIYMKTKNARLKKTIMSALPIGVLGIGEPLIYGVTLPLGKPFLGAAIGGACGGAVIAIFKVGAIAMGVSGIPLAILTNLPMQYLLGIAAAYIGGFIATNLLGFEDPAE